MIPMSSFYKRITVFVAVLGLAVATPVSTWAQGLGLGLGIAGATKTYDHTLDTNLVQAVRGGQVDEVQSLLKRGADPNAKDTDKYVSPVLMLAAGENENQDILRALLADKANVEITNAQGATPLIMASVDSHVESVKILLNAGAKIDARTSLGLTALMVAASAGELETTRFLLANKADVNARSKDNGTALIYGSAKTIAGTGNLDIIKTLVEAGADVGVTATNGKNAIATAKAYGLDNIATYLTEIETRDRALFNAVARAYADRNTPNSTAWDAVKTALDAGANPRFTTADGRTSLMFLAYDIPGCDAKTLQYFVSHSDLSAQEQQFGATALHLAVDNGNVTMVSLLIIAGAPQDIREKDGKTPLELAKTKENQAIILLLTPTKKDDDDDDTPEIPFFV